MVLDHVGEASVGHPDDDPVAGDELVDLPERRQVGGSVPGDRDCHALAGEGGVGIVARPLLEA